MLSKVRPFVFFVPFSLLLLTAIASVAYSDSFFEVANNCNQWILKNFDWLFSWGTFSFLIVLLITYFSPIASVKIGGANAKPQLNRWQWFTITLCTTIATGILFWGTAEPMYHLHQTPEGIQQPKAFAMSTLFMHWTFTPYGIYTLAGLVFALSFYNLKQPFSVTSMLFPLLGKKAYGSIGKLTDAICLFALVAGMAAALGAGILVISGGIDSFLNVGQGKLLYGITALIVVLSFVASSASGLLRGIRWLSDINIRVFVALGLFVLVTGPLSDMLSLGGKGLFNYFQNFIPRSISADNRLPDTWIRNWTVFYWANWLAWTPVTALFLGRISIGYTVREFIHFNLLLPSLFGGLWMLTFGGAALTIDVQQEGLLYQSLTEEGPQAVIYKLLEQLPFPAITSGVMLLAIFISYVTAADSNTSAMTSMSVRGVSANSPETPLGIKVLWGCLIGVISWIMIAFAGIDGIKMISNLGGLPALFLVLLISLGMIRLWGRKEELRG